ncbi:GNAT family N-acetyltransferase [Rhodococcus antarcticus]|uniref:GNAT family N-acetyltransferase n=1 Tax=Rhodococcus antarcticus TaxID=2987751 RepID=A0ABY6NW76_9NOCA|nr:GNAT family protein [Rhodococcus antarcticus]UZJ23647.1 GNAT family N-acetyltransferase [Rhodococcus antarcticus]
MTEHPDPWPLRHLVLRTPRLELRPDDDAGVVELVDLAHDGIHDPSWTPFLHPWTDAPAAELGPNTLRYFWSQRAALTPERWSVNFLIRVDGRVVGTQELAGRNFATTGEVVSGSWLGRAHQGQGLGTEMRAAVLLLAFDHLGARTARSEAFVDNPASLRVSRKLGYAADGTNTQLRRGKAVVEQRVLLTPTSFVRPTWQMQVDGLDSCRHQLGV